MRTSQTQSRCSPASIVRRCGDARRADDPPRVPWPRRTSPGGALALRLDRPCGAVRSAGGGDGHGSHRVAGEPDLFSSVQANRLAPRYSASAPPGRVQLVTSRGLQPVPWQGTRAAMARRSPAGVAQLAEHPPCKRTVSGSNPLTGSHQAASVSSPTCGNAGSEKRR